MNTETSLWGNLPLNEAVRTPLIILREQAAVLTKATNGRLVGSVKLGRAPEYDMFGKLTERATGNLPVFWATPNIETSALDGYVLQILQAEFSLEAYPVKVQDFLGQAGYDCSDENDFSRVLSTALTSPKARKAVGLLLAQSRSEEQAA